jgi:hypothetical protein
MYRDANLSIKLANGLSNSGYTKIKHVKNLILNVSVGKSSGIEPDFFMDNIYKYQEKTKLILQKNDEVYTICVFNVLRSMS